MTSGSPQAKLVETQSPPQPNGRSLTIVITGATGGIGYYTALNLAKANTTIIITGRDVDRGNVAAAKITEETKNPNIHFVVGEFSSLEKVDATANRILAVVDHVSLLRPPKPSGGGPLGGGAGWSPGGRKIDVLINNAGYLGDRLEKSDDGLEMHFAVNVLAVWRLTMRLVPAMRANSEPGSGAPDQESGSGAPNLVVVGESEGDAGASEHHVRVLNITGGDKPAKIDIDNLQAEKGFKGLMTYTHSKSIMEAMSVWLSKQLQSPDPAQNITVNVIFPGRASTKMTRSLTLASLPGPMKLFLPFMKLYFRDDGGKSAAKCSTSSVWGATSHSLESVTGKYFDTNCKEVKMHETAYDGGVQWTIMGPQGVCETAVEKKYGGGGA